MTIHYTPYVPKSVFEILLQMRSSRRILTISWLSLNSLQAYRKGKIFNVTDLAQTTAIIIYKLLVVYAVFFDRLDLAEFLDSFIAKKRFRCQQSSWTRRNTSNDVHINRVHLGMKTLFCPICGKRNSIGFQSSKSLVLYQRHRFYINTWNWVRKHLSSITKLKYEKCKDNQRLINLQTVPNSRDYVE